MSEQEILKNLENFCKEALKDALDNINQRLDDKELQEACINFARYQLNPNELTKQSWGVSLLALTCMYKRKDQDKMIAKIKDFVWKNLPLLIAIIRGGV